jgi:ABC-2 type transport system permease protein
MDFKLRYQGSALGYLWSFLKPLMLFAILYIIFSKYLKFGAGRPFASISLLLGIVIWNFFSEATSRSVTSIVERGDLIRKIKIPRYLIVLATVSSAGINFLLSLVVVALFIAFSGVSIGPQILFVPLLLLELLIAILAVSFFLSAVFVKFRDIHYIWEVFLQLGFYATPIIYPLEFIPSANAQKLIMINPIAQIVQGLKASAIYKGNLTQTDITSNPLLIAMPFLLITFASVVAVLYFKNQSKSFAENV